MKSLGELPLVVLSGDHHPTPYADWQCDLVQLSSRGVQLLAGDCGHWIHLDRPELVAQAIHQVVAAARPIYKQNPSRPVVQFPVSRQSATNWRIGCAADE